MLRYLRWLFISILPFWLQNLQWLTIFFIKIQTGSIFSNLIFFFIFFWKSFLCYKNADFQISKEELIVRLSFFFFFFLICDACIINLSHECGSSFKSLFYLFLTTDLVFHKPKIKILFYTLHKTYLILFVFRHL